MESNNKNRQEVRSHEGIRENIVTTEQTLVQKIRNTISKEHEILSEDIGDSSKTGKQCCHVAGTPQRHHTRPLQYCIIQG
jgi:hypothetical protein